MPQRATSSAAPQSSHERAPGIRIAHKKTVESDSATQRNKSRKRARERAGDRRATTPHRCEKANAGPPEVLSISLFAHTGVSMYPYMYPCVACIMDTRANDGPLVRQRRNGSFLFGGVGCGLSHAHRVESETHGRRNGRRRWKRPRDWLISKIQGVYSTVHE